VHAADPVVDAVEIEVVAAAHADGLCFDAPPLLERLWRSRPARASASVAARRRRQPAGARRGRGRSHRRWGRARRRRRIPQDDWRCTSGRPPTGRSTGPGPHLRAPAMPGGARRHVLGRRRRLRPTERRHGWFQRLLRQRREDLYPAHDGANGWPNLDIRVLREDGNACFAVRSLPAGPSTGSDLPIEYLQPDGQQIASAVLLSRGLIEVTCPGEPPRVVDPSCQPGVIIPGGTAPLMCCEYRMAAMATWPCRP
jgi:hypothetical protein